MADLFEELNALAAQAKDAMTKVADVAAREELRVKFLGRKSEIARITSELSKLASEERKRVGAKVNEVKHRIAEALGMVTGVSREEKIDPTLPGISPAVGHLHPLTSFLQKVVEIFQSMGFDVEEGPEVETEKYNFDLLNIPPHHPARDMHDTFWIKSKKERLLLRTHTSPVQIRAMATSKPPVRLIVPGRVFRNEATDAAHEAVFYQCEGLVIDKGIRVTDLIGTLQEFLKALFGNVKIRVRPHYYPFVEPCMDVDMSCLICRGAGCSVCKRTGWLEMLGSGMVHPNVLRNMHVDPSLYTGFAFGLGIDRFMMLYHGINDVRLSYRGDLRFIRQF